ncbi:damage-inducible protein DinB [Mesobacillus maritimus]|uniref:DinB family protein n=1 Tax=Mesobacillus maritimus TaxID=1643336 RepID=UPI00203A3A9B|nr:DinB family protein [Mesobacillus maritimus]MCM3584542.1 damage-inducible protein DinB [Mesobacillus maritimus]
MNTIRMMYDHLFWANQKLLDTLTENRANDQQQLLSLFSHLLLTEKLWMARMQENDLSSIAIWGDFTVEECHEMSRENHRIIQTMFDSLSEAELDVPVCYQNSEGKQHTNTKREILTHVALHGHYHRGQMNLKLRELGSKPISTDFIIYKRSLD